MDDMYTKLRVWRSTAQKLKIIAALRRDSMIAVLEQLVEAEYTRMQVPEPETKEEACGGV